MTEQTTTTTTGAESAEDSHRTAHAAAHGVAAHLAAWCDTDRDAEAAAVAGVPERSTWPPAAQRANIRAGYARRRLAVAAARYAAAYIERELASDDAAYLESEQASDAAAEGADLGCDRGRRGVRLGALGGAPAPAVRAVGDRRRGRGRDRRGRVHVSAASKARTGPVGRTRLAPLRRDHLRDGERRARGGEKSCRRTACALTSRSTNWRSSS